MAIGESLSAPHRIAQCAVCGGEGAPAFQISKFSILQCASCDHQFVGLESTADHVERIYADDYFQGGGAGYSDYRSEERLLIARGKWYARRLSRLTSAGSVLDVGAAAGYTLNGFEQAGWQCFGVEPNQAMAEYATQRFGYPVAAGAFEAWNPGRSFDLITMLQVLPHFVDPREALVHARQILCPGGKLLIETWNRASWTARLFGRNWHEYSPPSVLHWFSKAGLSRLAGDVGFAPLAWGRPAKWIEAGHAKSLLKQKAAGSLLYRCAFCAAQLIPDRLALPYPAEDLFWVLLQRT